MANSTRFDAWFLLSTAGFMQLAEQHQIYRSAAVGDDDDDGSDSSPVMVNCNGNVEELISDPWSNHLQLFSANDLESLALFCFELGQ